MRWMLMVVLVLFFTGLIAYGWMAMQSQKTPAGLGLQQGVLSPCPDSPNCVCSETHSQASKEHAVAPIPAADGMWEKLKTRIVGQGGVIESDDGHYLHATFRSPVFRYVDDVEMRLDTENGLIHIRSASRAGRSDFGVNRKRVASLLR
ncbi:MAG: DUF1499 domain-containing protein [Mariprofundus sp.]